MGEGYRELGRLEEELAGFVDRDDATGACGVLADPWLPSVAASSPHGPGDVIAMPNGGWLAENNITETPFLTS